MQKVIVIVGPTGVGKTKLSIELAKKLDRMSDFNMHIGGTPIMRTIRFGILATGDIAARLADTIATVEHAEVLAVGSRTMEKAEAMAVKYGGRVYTSLEEALTCEKPDVLHICTPHYLHVPMAIQGLRSGAHVFMEKPPVISGEQLEELKAAVLEIFK